MNYNPDSKNLPTQPRIAQSLLYYYDNLVYIGPFTNPSLAAKYNNNNPFIAFIYNTFFTNQESIINKLPTQELTYGNSLSLYEYNHVFLGKDSPLLSIIAPPLAKPSYDPNKLPKTPAIPELSKFFNSFPTHHMPVFIGTKNFKQLFQTFTKYTTSVPQLPSNEINQTNEINQFVSFNDNNEITLSFNAHAISLFDLRNQSFVWPLFPNPSKQSLVQSSIIDEDILFFLDPYDTLLSTIAPISHINPKSILSIQSHISSLTTTLITNLQQLDNKSQYDLLNNISQQLHTIKISLNIENPHPNDDIIL